MALPSNVRRALATVRRRVRLQRALDAGSVLLVAGLGLAAIVLTLVKTGALAEPEGTRWFWVAAALPVLGVLLGALRPVSRLLPAQLVDRSHGLRSRLANAQEFAEAEERTPFMDAAIADAEARAKDIEAKRAMPLRAPRDLLAAAALGLGVFGLAQLEVPERQAVALPPQLAPMLLDSDALDAFDSSLDPVLRDRETSEDVRTAARQLNQILEDIADRRLDRAEALRRIQALEQQLAEGRPMDAQAMQESLRDVGRELDRASLAEAASEALRDANASEAADAVRELATRLETEAPSRRELDR
ncbi:MAG TPA: hypothetical protein RMG45_33205, partial [Polyangiaceae bacterium LLY-WYZ-15_(1-7)]|nr:hypothetical protein [Polyangiaceae bacterium LLY-WYZ-15_(1-7)]